MEDLLPNILFFLYLDTNCNIIEKKKKKNNGNLVEYYLTLRSLTNNNISLRIAYEILRELSKIEKIVRSILFTSFLYIIFMQM